MSGEKKVSTAQRHELEEAVLSKDERKRRKKLREELHGSGPVALAFERVCKAGCAAEWLENELVPVGSRFPFRRTRAMLPAATRRKFGQIIRGLEVTSDRLSKILDQPGMSLIFLKVEEKEWPTPWHELPSVLRKMATNLRTSLSSPIWRPRRFGNPARFRIPYLIEQIRQATGRPHYADMATLLGAAYDRTPYSEQDLKMLVSRARHRRLR